MLKLKIREQSTMRTMHIPIPTALVLVLAPVLCGAGTFKAAVYEHKATFPNMAKVVSRSDAVRNMNKNLDVYKVQAELAKNQGAQIIVFPEKGITGFMGVRKVMDTYFEVIPDPLKVTWSPCMDPFRFKDIEVLYELSCMARDNGLYVVAGVGDKQPCVKSEDRGCPSDERYYYNTAVVMSPNGTLVAKYHKLHLFNERAFDTPKPEVVTFDTPFGRFGLSICWDAMKREPLVAMVMDQEVPNIVFPTAWYNGPPSLTSVGFVSGVARGLGINVLSANLHYPRAKFTGSGLFSPEGVQAFYHDDDVDSDGRLLVSTLNVLDKPKLPVDVSRPDLAGFREGATFQGEFFDDRYTFVKLDKTLDRVKVCDGGFCCGLSYAMDSSTSYGDVFALGVFQGLHTADRQMVFFENCLLVKCASDSTSSCGQDTTVSHTHFRQLELTGQFSTRFVYPQVVTSVGDDFHFSNSFDYDRAGVLKISSTINQPLLSVSLIGRDYKDDNDDDIFK